MEQQDLPTHLAVPLVAVAVVATTPPTVWVEQALGAEFV
jgi:hypothetical protein